LITAFWYQKGGVLATQTANYDHSSSTKYAKTAGAAITYGPINVVYARETASTLARQLAAAGMAVRLTKTIKGEKSFKTLVNVRDQTGTLITAVAGWSLCCKVAMQVYGRTVGFVLLATYTGGSTTGVHDVLFIRSGTTNPLSNGRVSRGV
jgi:hypothetical protein